MPTIGTCSKCNGPVQVPDLWGGTVPPAPTCTHCGATAKDPYGPTIPMEKRSLSLADAASSGDGRIAATLAPAPADSELVRLRERVKVLEEAMEEVLPFVITDTTECRGDKCRDIWCISCQGEEDACDSAARASQALQKAVDALAARRKQGGSDE